MKLALLDSFTPPRHALRALGAAACALALLGAGPASAQSGGESVAMTLPTSPGAATATLEQCVASTVPAERSATFTGEMTSIPGAARMAMRVDLEERIPGEVEFHSVSAAGLGMWRSADPKVKVYKYLKQVANLAAPASYRGLVRFRWVNAKGHVIKRAERLTARCMQPGSGMPEATSPGNSAMPSTPSA